ncbi:hypothetical protein AAZX31_11G191500 [Glycine max]
MRIAPPSLILLVSLRFEAPTTLSSPTTFFRSCKFLKRRSLKRISFLAHSLGGLFARYAIDVLYSPDTYSKDQPSDLGNNMTENS